MHYEVKLSCLAVISRMGDIFFLLSKTCINLKSIILFSFCFHLPLSEYIINRDFFSMLKPWQLDYSYCETVHLNYITGCDKTLSQ